MSLFGTWYGAILVAIVALLVFTFIAWLGDRRDHRKWQDEQ